MMDAAGYTPATQYQVARLVVIVHATRGWCLSCRGRTDCPVARQAAAYIQQRRAAPTARPAR